VVAIATRLARADIVDDRVPDLVGAMLLARQILAKGRSRDFGDMLVLGDGEHFLFGEAAKGQTVFKNDHRPFAWRGMCRRRTRSRCPRCVGAQLYAIRHMMQAMAIVSIAKSTAS